MIAEKKQVFTQKGTKINEDRAFITKNSAWIIDGATGLGKNIIDKNSDAKWLSDQWNDFLKHNIENTKDSLEEIFLRGQDIISKKYKKLTKNQKVSKLDEPSAGIALIRKNGNYLEYFVLGDCMTSLNKKDKIQNLTMSDLSNFEKQTFNIFKKERAKYPNKDILSLRHHKPVMDQLIKTRLLKNIQNGYWVLSTEKEAIKHALKGKIYFKEISQILIMSDGFYSLIEKYNQTSYMDLFKLADTHSLEYINQQIRKIENKDPNGFSFPRFKKSDDSSAVYIKIK